MATNDGTGADRAKDPSKQAPAPEGTVGQGMASGAHAKERSKQVQAPAAGGSDTGGGAAGQRGAGTVPYGGGPLGLPEKFGRYHVVKKLGGGGMGAVFLVENTELKREEALKVPHFDFGGDPMVRERFLREARSAAQLDHPNLCPVYDVGVLDGVCYLTMRYLKGKLLSDYAGTPQPPRKAVEIVTKLAQALGSAHGKGVIHRDLKPNNVMMCAGVGPVVMDFGLAKQIRQEDQKLTQSGTTLGTPAYMPPEQVTGDLERMGPATDVYSLGVILYELLTGRLPFKGTTAAEVYGKILHTEAPPPSSLRAGLNPVLDALCNKAMAKAPEARYRSMKDFAAALIEYLKATPPTEGAGALTATKAGPAEIFQAPTVAPGHAAAATPQVRAPHPPAPTQKGVKAASAIRRPASTQRPQPHVRPRDDEQGRGGVSIAGVLGWCVLVLLMLGALGGVGYLIYTLNQKKAAPPPDVALAATPASSPGGGTAGPGTPGGTNGTGTPGGGTSGPGTPVGPGATGPPSGGTSGPGTPVGPGATGPPSGGTPGPGTPVGPGATGSPSGGTPGPGTPVGPGATGSPSGGTPGPGTPVGPGATGPPSGGTPGPGAPSGPPAGGPPKPADPKPPMPDEPDPTVLLNEDFKEVEVGGRPKDWDGDDFAVQKENGRPCLEVTNPKELHYVTLPKLAVKGDFVMDCEIYLGFRQRFHLDLESRSSTPLTISVDHVGTVQIDQAEAKATEGLAPYENKIRFRLKRKGDVYNVSINDKVTAGLTLPGKGTFNEIRIGLPGGKTENFGLARLYSIRILSLEKPSSGTVNPDKTPPPPLPGVREDFGKVTAGTLPDGWRGSSAGNLGVQKTGDTADLELTNTTLGGDIVILPNVDLKGDFFADVEVVFPDRNTAVDLLFKGPKVAPLALELDGGGVIIVAGKFKLDGSKAWIGKANVLRLERSDAGYVVKLNGTPIGPALPLTVAPGPFKEVDLALAIKDAKRKSPRITAVRVQPLEAPNP